MQPVADARHRGDPVTAVRLIAQEFAQDADLHREVGLFHRQTRPPGFQKRLPANGRALRVDQSGQQSRTARVEPTGSRSRSQRHQRCVKTVRTEGDARHSHNIPRYCPALTWSFAASAVGFLHGPVTRGRNPQTTRDQGQAREPPYFPATSGAGAGGTMRWRNEISSK